MLRVLRGGFKKLKMKNSKFKMSIMRTSALFFNFAFVIFNCLALTSTDLRAEDEQQLIAVLQSGAAATMKCDACQQLKTIATVQSVSALSALLGEERTAHAARNVLETIPGTEAGAALRDAVSKTSGVIKAGLIDSLGRRHEVGSLPVLKPLLQIPTPRLLLRQPLPWARSVERTHWQRLRQHSQSQHR